MKRNSSFVGLNNSSTEDMFNRDNELRRSTGSMKTQRSEMKGHATSSYTRVGLITNQTSDSLDTPGGPRRYHKNMNSEDAVDAAALGVGNLIKAFNSGQNSKMKNGHRSDPQSDGYSSHTEYSSKNIVDINSPHPERKRQSTKRKLSLRRKKQNSVDQARYSILQSLGMSPFAGNENRNIEKSYAYFDAQSLFFDLQNAVALKSSFEDGNYTKKVSGASAASVRRKRFKSGEFDPEMGRFRSRTESMIDEGDDNENDLVLSCPYFRNEISDPEDSIANNDSVFTKPGKDINQLIAMFNRTRTGSLENFETKLSYDGESGGRRSHISLQSQPRHAVLFENVDDDSLFSTWDDPKNLSERRIFELEHLDEGCLYYREYFQNQGKDLFLSPQIDLIDLFEQYILRVLKPFPLVL